MFDRFSYRSSNSNFEAEKNQLFDLPDILSKPIFKNLPRITSQSITSQNEDNIAWINTKKETFPCFSQFMLDFVNGISEKTHTYRFKVYKKSFYGNKAIDWLIAKKYATNNEEAVKIMQFLFTRYILNN